MTNPTGWECTLQVVNYPLVRVILGLPIIACFDVWLHHIIIYVHNIVYHIYHNYIYIYIYMYIYISTRIYHLHDIIAK